MSKGILLRRLLLLVCVLAGVYIVFFRDVNATTPGVECEVHDLPLEVGRVRIEYGLFRPSSAEDDAREKFFPHAASVYGGGCVVTPLSPTHARVSFCPECRKAEAAWMKNREKQMAPVRAHWERVRAVLEVAPRFQRTHAFIDRGEIPKVGIGGQVSTDADLAELQRVVEGTAPPNPVLWNVRVGP